MLILSGFVGQTLCGLLMVFGEQISQEIPNDEVQIEVDSSKIFSTNELPHSKFMLSNLWCTVFGLQV